MIREWYFYSIREEPDYGSSQLGDWLACQTWDFLEGCQIVLGIDPRLSVPTFKEKSPTGIIVIYFKIVRFLGIRKKLYGTAYRHRLEDGILVPRSREYGSECAEVELLEEKVNDLIRQGYQEGLLHGPIKVLEMITWALKKGVEIPWLDWANKEKLVTRKMIITGEFGRIVEGLTGESLTEKIKPIQVRGKDVLPDSLIAGIKMTESGFLDKIKNPKSRGEIVDYIEANHSKVDTKEARLRLAISTRLNREAGAISFELQAAFMAWRHVQEKYPSGIPKGTTCAKYIHDWIELNYGELEDKPLARIVKLANPDPRR